jgi:hypothetical protein
MLGRDYAVVIVIPLSLMTYTLHHHEFMVHIRLVATVREPSHAASRPKSSHSCCTVDICIPSPLSHVRLDNRLQLPRIPQRILNDLITRNQNILAQIIILLLREVYPTILNHPSTLLRKVDHTALRIQEQERLGISHGDGRVRALAAGCDFLADRADEDL